MKHMFYRRKLLLAVLEQLGGHATRIRLQKLLFHIAQDQQKPRFHFVPYKFGPFSFQAHADCRTMEKYKQVVFGEHKVELLDKQGWLPELTKTDQEIVSTVLRRFGKVGSDDDLMRITYRDYPYYAINSEIKDRLLEDFELQSVELVRPQATGTTLFTIGYEGRSQEEYLNILINRGVKLLCDVRRNAMSMKFGFSKSQLAKACNGVGIEYIHFSQVGIDSSARQTLETKADYDRLFAKYIKTTLKTTTDVQQEILDLLHTKKRIALTCFEGDSDYCHRQRLADSMLHLSKETPPLVHL